ncbi:hypothetical protein ACQKD9_18455 [Bacillus paramycoides]|uniref:response regulator aspartate phosphatase n=1 Tax=Bacillus paramycoides TaxID=2026194 RepID=UPI003D07267C
MGTDIAMREQLKHSLDDWYRVMLQQQIEKAMEMKEEIDSKIPDAKEDGDLWLYYSLLDFRYKVLADGLQITKNSFDKIDEIYKTSENRLSYYYYFFKAMHATLISNYNDASRYYEKAEKLIKYVPDELEYGEFCYRLSAFFYSTRQPMNTIKYVNKAKEIFSKQAEECLNSAIDILQKQDNAILLLRVRHNLGWLYASQNLSALAIRHLSEVTEKIPTHFKAVFLQAREHFKLGETNISKELIDRGLNICIELENEEYIHHFSILKAINNNVSIKELETIILKGITYFDKESLYSYTQEYAEKLAVEFYDDANYMKASEYFYKALQAKEKKMEKGALK